MKYSILRFDDGIQQEVVDNIIEASNQPSVPEGYSVRAYVEGDEIYIIPEVDKEIPE